jgi:hypothetical protein
MSSESFRKSKTDRMGHAQDRLCFECSIAIKLSTNDL